MAGAIDSRTRTVFNEVSRRTIIGDLKLLGRAGPLPPDTIPIVEKGVEALTKLRDFSSLEDVARNTSREIAAVIAKELSFQACTSDGTAASEEKMREAGLVLERLLDEFIRTENFEAIKQVRDGAFSEAARTRADAALDSPYPSSTERLTSEIKLAVMALDDSNAKEAPQAPSGDRGGGCECA